MARHDLGTKKSSWRMTRGGPFPAGKEIELADEMARQLAECEEFIF
ncbi:hypothetical protein [Persicirhabdus sediminis]|uniref:Uncharacterized protein n=1 Tax=Persicirhabdus sediminis TaxID=454144 RepID=A0A8J7SJH4_9BACT|nr:hypothetical protein [Persicirhabdus sediminis]MBK1792150.1 hypothetical protein [Persicirhabdus sediminis]